MASNITKRDVAGHSMPPEGRPYPNSDIFPKGLSQSVIDSLGLVTSLPETQGTEEHVELHCVCNQQNPDCGRLDRSNSLLLQKLKSKGKKRVESVAKNP